MAILEEISTYLQQGRSPKVKELVAQALDEGIDPETILNDGLMAGMNVIGGKFKNNEVFVPEVLIAARSMNMGVEILKPHLVKEGHTSAGTVVIGTIKGDLHDIGKNLVKMMMESRGLTVCDLGVDVEPQVFIDKALELNAKVIGVSALLTTTMQTMAEVVKAAEAAGVRNKIKIMVGGAPVTQLFSESIGADCYTDNATTAAEMAYALCTD